MKRFVVPAVFLLCALSPLNLFAQNPPKTARRAVLGVDIQGYQPLLPPARYIVGPLGDENVKGASIAYVFRVKPEGPAERAGIKSGDILIAVDGQLVKSKDRLIEILSQYRPGDRPKIIFLREYHYENKIGNAPLILYGEAFPVLAAAEADQSGHVQPAPSPASPPKDDLVID